MATWHALEEQLASKDAEIAQLQEQLSAQGGQAAATTSRLETVKARVVGSCAPAGLTYPATVSWMPVVAT